MSAALVRDFGSFRDPAGVVLIGDKRVFRTIEQSVWSEFDALQSAGTLKRLVSEGRVIATWPAEINDAPVGWLDQLRPGPRRLVEHERIPFISYPYEWPFSLLKRAALLHLTLHIDLIGEGFTLSDASAYNVQFKGASPVFIDVLSMRRYRDGEYWAGYRQFCEQFLNPLLLVALNGVPYHAWLRGSIEGIPVEDMARILSPRSKFSWRVLMHVVLHARMAAKARRETKRDGKSDLIVAQRPMSKASLVWLLKGMRTWITGLEPRGIESTAWKEYARQTVYTGEETEAKRAFVRTYVEQHRPTELLDLGCNTGSYAQVALAAGANRVIGFDFDHGALEDAVATADREKLNFLPLFLDATSPSPDQGWAQRERRGFKDRSHGDGLLALAFLHHIVIGRNVPLGEAVEWLVGLAPSGVIEFVPKQDSTIQKMLAHRDDIFANYDIDSFRHELTQRVFIARERVVSSSGRTLFEYRQ